jgi:hypothetical protein
VSVSQAAGGDARGDALLELVGDLDTEEVLEELRGPGRCWVAQVSRSASSASVNVSPRNSRCFRSRADLARAHGYRSELMKIDVVPASARPVSPLSPRSRASVAEQSTIAKRRRDDLRHDHRRGR